MKAVKIIGLGLLVLALIFGAVLWYVANKYEEILKNVVLEQINLRLDTQVDVKDLQVSPFSELPYISLDFEEVFIPAKKVEFANSDTLLYTERLSLHFNVLDVLNEDYRARKISLGKAVLNLETDQDGSSNFEIWKAQSDTGSGFLLNLESFATKELDFRYRSDPQFLKIEQQVQSFQLFGQLSDTELDCALSAKLESKTLQYKSQGYLEREELDLAIPLYYNFETKNLQLRSGGELFLNGNKWHMEGDVRPDQFDLKAGGDRIQLTELFDLIPTSTTSFLEGIRGLADADLIMKKAVGEEDPGIDLSFTLEDASYQITEEYALSQVDLKGTYSNGSKRSLSSSQLSFEGIAGLFNGTPFEGSVQIQNLSSPKFSYYLNSQNLSFQSFCAWTGLDSSLAEPSGKLNLILEGKSRAKTFAEVELKTFLLQELTGDLRTSGLSFALDEIQVEVNELEAEVENGQFQFKTDGQLMDQSFETSGEMAGLLHWLYEDNAQIKIRNALFLDALNLDDFSSEESEAGLPKIPEWLWLNSKLRFNTFEYKNFLASNVDLNLQHRGNSTQLYDVQLDVARGKMSGKVDLNYSEKGLSIRSSSDFSQLDLANIFLYFDQFGQSTLTSKNLEGTVSGSSKINMSFNSDFEFVPSRLLGEAELVVVEGRLKNFGAMDAVAEFFDSNIILRKVFKANELRSRLKDIEFDTLTNVLLIQNEEVVVPQMDIQSSVLDLLVDGRYRFDHEVDFHLDFYITDLMSKGESSSEFGEIEDDGTGRKRVFLNITGPIDDPSFSLDKKKRKEQRKEIIQREKELVKELILEEIKEGPTESMDLNETFEVEWSPDEEIEEKSTAEQPKDSSGATEEKPKGIKGFLKKLKLEDSTKVEGEFEFDDDDL